MSLTLLAPWALLAAVLLAVPVIIHLLKPRRVRQTPFSSLRWLHLTPQKLSRRIQWHQVLLFLLRAGLIVLLVLALARPLLTTGGEGGSRERFIVVDVSHSMGYRTAGQPTPMERAKEIAAELVRRNSPGDRTAILLTDAQTLLLSPLSDEPEKYIAALERVEAGQGETDLGSALPVIRGLLAKPRDGARAEVWVVTDNQQHAWNAGSAGTFLEGLGMPVEVRVVDVGVSNAQNAWISRVRLLEMGKSARPIVRVEMGCVGDAVQERTVQVDRLGQSKEITLSPGRPTVVDFAVPAGTKLDGGLLRARLEPGDALPGDDEYLLNLDTQGMVRVLLVEGPASVADPQPGGHTLRTALEALAETEGRLLRRTSVSSVEVRASDFREADVIFLADVPELGDEVLAALEERVRGGAGVAIVLGGSGKPGFLNERLYRPLDPAGGLLPAPVRPVDADEDRLAPLTSVQWTHPLLTGLGDPIAGEFARVRFRRWFEFTRPLAERSLVLARIDEGAPAIIDRTVGAGRVVVLNTGAGDRWSDFSRRVDYVPFVDRLLAHLSATGMRRNFVAGELVSVPLSDWQMGETVTVKSPGDKKMKPIVRGAGAGKGLVSFEAAEAGVYRIERGDSEIAVVVQVGRGDSVLEPTASATLQRWWAPAECTLIRGADLDKHLTREGGRFGLWPTLLLIAGLILLTETYLVHRLCPKANPKLARNIVAPHPAGERGA